MAMPKLRAKTSLLLTAGLLTVGASCSAAQSTGGSTTAEYLSDHPELILSSQQAWGELGWDVAAHQSGVAGASLRVGGQSYAKGLGHHANGVITLLLDGAYTAFDAEVGLQPCDGGSVVFRVFADGELRFDSGVLRPADAPKPIHVALAGVQELRLEANDAGDGITCDMANWANAFLTRSSTAPRLQAETGVDVGPFARVATWDPRRMDGARASRVEEFRADDLFLETDVPRGASGSYRVPVNDEGVGCIGLQWLNRRALKTLALDFAEAAQVPATGSVQVQAWSGESAWQGSWRALAGDLQAAGNRLVFHLAPKAGFLQTQKVRWIFPTKGSVALRGLSAFTHSRWQEVNLLVQLGKPASRGHAELRVFNGELIRCDMGKGGARGRGADVPSRDGASWQGASPMSLSVRCSRNSSFKSDSTILQFRLPTGAVGVAVEDVLSNNCVYLPDYGLFVTRDPAPITLAAYQKSFASRKTILQQVRELPDQTLSQAMAKTHHEAQREGPVLLSLACDNTKFVLNRDGSLRFPGTTNASGDWFASAGELRPQFGNGPLTGLTRALDGGWLPIPVVSVENGGVTYRERVFVVPGDEPGDNPARLNRPSVCVAEFSVTNPQPVTAEASLTLTFAPPKGQNQPILLPGAVGGVFALSADGLNGMVVLSKSSLLHLRTNGAAATFTGELRPGRVARVAVCLADPRVDLATVRPRVNELRDKAESYWKAVLAPAMQVETPDPFLNDVIRSSQVRCLIDARNEADGARIAPWIAAMSYGPLESEANSVIRGMAFMGHEDFARRGLDFFIHRYNTNGFLTTGYTTFGTAWHLWTLGDCYQLYHNTNWLRQAAPEITRVAEWIERQTEKTRRTSGGRNVPEYGLMPPGVLADWNSFAYHFTMNAYYYAALRGVGTALSDLPGTPAPGGALRQAAALRTNLLNAYHWTQAQAPALRLRNGAWIPHYPSQVHSPGKLADFFPGQDGGRSWCYDVELGAHQLIAAGVFAPRDRESDRIMDHMEDVQFLSDGWFDYPASMNEKDWFNLGGFSKVQPYYTRNCEVYALRNDRKPFVRSYFNTIAAMLNPEVMTFWEHFNHSGAWDKTHETGYFLHQTRTMLVNERGDELWLAPLITTNWLSEGLVLSVKNAPTRFGPVSYTITSHVADGLIEATINPPARTPPSRLVLWLRHPAGSPLRSVLVNSRKQKDFDRDTGVIRVKPGNQPLIVQVFYAPVKAPNPASR